MRKNNFMNKIIKLKGSILAGIIQIFACLIVYKFNIPNPNIVLFVVLSASIVQSGYLAECMEHAWDAGLVVVVAAGNMGPHAGSVTVPGTNKKVITVGAFDDCIFPGGCYSGRGPTQECICKPEITAPGSNIRSCSSTWYLDGRKYCIKSGTSMAAPVVSGAIALLLEKEPHLTNVEVKMRLKNCARNLNLPKYQQGWGMIDVNLLLT